MLKKNVCSNIYYIYWCIRGEREPHFYYCNGTMWEIANGINLVYCRWSEHSWLVASSLYADAKSQGLIIQKGHIYPLRSCHMKVNHLKYSGEGDSIDLSVLREETLTLYSVFNEISDDRSCVKKAWMCSAQQRVTHASVTRGHHCCPSQNATWRPYNLSPHMDIVIEYHASGGQSQQPMQGDSRALFLYKSAQKASPV